MSQTGADNVTKQAISVRDDLLASFDVNYRRAGISLPRFDSIGETEHNRRRNDLFLECYVRKRAKLGRVDAALFWLPSTRVWRNSPVLTLRRGHYAKITVFPLICGL
jgi:hypothetical protein